MLAQAAESLPAPGALPGGTVWEIKYDGFRALLFTPLDPGGTVLLQSRRGALIQDRFPDLVAAVGQLPDGLVLDGELVVWDHGVLSFEALQRRAATGARNAAKLAADLPAYFIAFDVLQADGADLTALPYTARRQRLEDLFTTRALTAPRVLCPMTADLAVADEWLTTWTDVTGIEGVVAKGKADRYRFGRRGWIKVRRRDTTEAVIGAATGTLTRPQLLLLGRYDNHGRLRYTGRTTPLNADAARTLAPHLTPADSGHPWKGRRFTSTWGSRDVLAATLLHPDLVAEVSGDTAMDRGGIWRHPVRYVRLRTDVTAEDIPRFAG